MAEDFDPAAIPKDYDPELDEIEQGMADDELDPAADPDPESQPIEEFEIQEEYTMTDEEENSNLIILCEQYELEDQLARDRHLRSLKKKELFWRGEQRLFWSELDNAWRSITEVSFREREELNITDSDRVINIYRPLGESIIAALTIGIPVTKFFPDDADNPDDISKAKAYSQMGEIIQKHNKAAILFVKGVQIRYNQGLVASYCYLHEDSKYGTRKVEKFQGTETQIDPETGQPIQVRKVDILEEAKSRVCMGLYGPLNVHVPAWVREQKYTPYIEFEFEQHVSLVRATFPEKYDEIRPTSYGDNYYERFARSRNADEDQSDLCTVKTWWFRDWAFAKLRKEQYEYFIKKYSSGLKVTTVNRTVLEKIEENVDDHWTLTFPILSETIHEEALGEPAIEIQELRNDAVNLTDQTMRHAIPETFADGQVLNFEAYEQTEKLPGQIYQVKGIAGQPLSAGFHTIKTAQLSQEVDSTIRRLDQDGQFVTGAFPSVYGGTAVGGSKTFAEYSMSRNQALQRLSTHWKALGQFWADTIYVACNIYAGYLKENNEDVRDVKENGDSFVNVYVKAAELEGRVGRAEPEANENFPLTAGQKRDVLNTLMQLNNDMINQVIYHPENAEIVAAALGFSDIYLPGQDNRNKQLRETQALLKGQPTQQGEMMIPSVMTDPDVDDAEVHIETLKVFLVSEVGQWNKINNEAGYANCLAHLKLHMMAQQIEQMNQASQGGQEVESENTNQGGSPTKPIEGMQ